MQQVIIFFGVKLFVFGHSGGTQINLLLQFGGNDVFQKKQPARSGVSRLVSLIGEDVKQDHAKQLLDDIAEAEGKAVDEKQESLELAMLTPEQVIRVVRFILVLSTRVRRVTAEKSD